NQTLAEGVHQQIPQSGVTVAGGSWPPEGVDPEEPVDPVDPPVSEGCDSVTQYSWKQQMEIDLSQANCIAIDRDLSGKTVQVWDSDANSSCDFRGMLSSVD
ncbi:hypothetical protein, partial [Vibrio sp. F13]